MTDEIAHRRLATRGEQAKRILEQDIVKDVFAEMDRALFEEWQNTAYGEQEKRESIYLMHRANREFKHQMERIMATGKASAKELAKINDQSKLRRIFNG